MPSFIPGGKLALLSRQLSCILFFIQKYSLSKHLLTVSRQGNQSTFTYFVYMQLNDYIYH